MVKGSGQYEKLIAVRVPRHVAERIREAARKIGTTPSAAHREALERGLSAILSAAGQGT